MVVLSAARELNSDQNLYKLNRDDGKRHSRLCSHGSLQTVPVTLGRRKEPSRTSEAAAPSISSLKEYLAELNKRYPLLLAKLEELKKEAAVPPDVCAGIKFAELYRVLDGMAQFAVLMRTPEEVKDLRQKLRTKVIQLANLRAKRQQQPANP